MIKKDIDKPGPHGLMEDNIRGRFDMVEEDVQGRRNGFQIDS
jgi:hypothetical protein